MGNLFAATRHQSLHHVIKQERDAFLRNNATKIQCVFEEIHKCQQEELTRAIAGLMSSTYLGTKLISGKSSR